MLRPGQRGLVLVGLLIVIALLGVAAVRLSEAASTSAQRERENQLLWVGQQYRMALDSYYRMTPGPIKHLPVQLTDLLLDPRFPQPVRHLRQLYPDPIQPDIPWGIVRQGNQIIGIYSQSDGVPFRQANFPQGLESFEGAGHYSNWMFIYVPRTPGARTPPATVPTRPSPSTAPTLPRKS